MGALSERFKNQFRWKNVYLNSANPSDFYLSCWQKGKSAVPLLLWRTVIFLLNLAILVASLGVPAVLFDGHIDYWAIYMTNWGLALNTLATGFGVAVSAICYKHGPFDATFGLPLYVKGYWILNNMAVTMSFLITVFYWSFLTDVVAEYEEKSLDETLDVFTHAINSVSMFLWLVSARHESRVYHVTHPVLFAVVYLVFNIIYYLAGGVNEYGLTWIYPSLDWAYPGPTVIMTILTTLLVIIIHIVVVAMATARDALARLYRGDSNNISNSEF